MDSFLNTYNCQLFWQLEQPFIEFVSKTCWRKNFNFPLVYIPLSILVMSRNLKLESYFVWHKCHWIVHVCPNSTSTEILKISEWFDM